MCLGIKEISEAEIVECPDAIVSGNMKVKIKEGSNPWWAAYQVLNTKNPINGMSMSTDGGATWVEMAGPEDPAPSGFWFMKPDGLILNADNGMENYKIRVESDTGDIVVDMVGVVDGGETDAGTNNAGGGDCTGSGSIPSPVPPPVPSPAPSITPSPIEQPSTKPTSVPAPTPSAEPPSPTHATLGTHMTYSIFVDFILPPKDPVMTLLLTKAHGVEILEQNLR